MTTGVVDPDRARAGEPVEESGPAAETLTPAL